MDSATARGRFHTIEGWEIDELALSAGRASFRLGGNLLGPRQQAEFHVKEFPAEWLQPMMQALPPMVGAAGAPAPRPAMAGPSPPPDRAGGRERERGLLGQLYPPQLRNAVDRLPFVGGASTRVVPAGPVSGLVFLEGRLSGSKDEPQARVVRVPLFCAVSTGCPSAQRRARVLPALPAPTPWLAGQRPRACLGRQPGWRAAGAGRGHGGRGCRPAPALPRQGAAPGEPGAPQGRGVAAHPGKGERAQ